jgi:hypothetical protein
MTLDRRLSNIYVGIGIVGLRPPRRTRRGRRRRGALRAIARIFTTFLSTS